MRINKRMSELGLCSRREGDTLIEAGKVIINGVPATLGQQVTDSDKIEIIGTQKKLTYYAYNKPRGVITHSPAPHETDIVTRVKADHGITGANPIGRLDKDSEGLIILSNDGRLTTKLIGADSQIEKEYLVSVDKPVSERMLTQLITGVEIEGYTTKPAAAHKLSPKTFTLTLIEGKKHQIRRMCAALGYQVQSLKRIRIGNLQLENQTPGSLTSITPAEIGV